ncbi:hypothetical protein Q7P37_008221 [Cladosporium fusiforme]
MSFGFGSGNTGSTFGGFGSTNNNNSTSGGSLFGGNTSTSGGFGGGATGGFGSTNTNTSNPFGGAQNKTTFGSPAATSTGGGMFGGAGQTSTTGGFGGGGGFGAQNNTASTGFGSANTSGGGLFGQSKPATGGFGGSTTGAAGGGLFGSSNTGGGFGGNNNAAASNPFGGSTAGASNPFGGSAAPSTGGFGANNTSNAGSGFAFGGGNNAAAAPAGNTNQGTAATPFSPFTEKDGAGSSQTSAYQSITMMPAYQSKSFEELRVEDYMQNRRLPQSGSFGGGNTFGGFGGQNNTAAPATQSGGGLFGGGNTGATGGFGATNNTTSTGFGANTNTSSGFGASNTGGGLFGGGAAKPATGGGLFGNNAASSGTSTGGFGGATSGSGGGLFGNSTTNNQTSTGGGFGGGFGGGAANTNNASGGLFGQNNNQTQNKPAFGGFGQSATQPPAAGGFGQANNTTQQQGGGLFGNSTSNTTGGFGASNNAGGSLFGGQQNKPAGGGLFGGSNTGASNTGGGLFGGANNTNTNTQGTGFGQSTTNTGGGLFGGANNQQQPNAGGSLFGNSQNKPAGGGLFGASTTGGNTGGGLFGNNQQQQNSTTGGSLFGGNNNQQQGAGGSLFGGQQNKPASGGLFGGSTGGGGSLFGNNQNQNTGGGGLFGGGNNQNQGGGSSLFGGNNQNQNQGAGSSLFGGSQQQQPQQNQLTATLTGDPYGNAQLFSSLAAPSPPVGPLATPLAGAKAPPKPRTSLLSSVRGGTPGLGASQSMTPRTRPGYGFSYSTYNSPGSGAQNLTPGAAGLLRPTGSLGSSLSGRLSKSFSTSNLRNENGAEGHSLLKTPGPGQSSLLLGNGNGSLGTGSARKLKIDRQLRTDLFGDNTPKQKQIEAAKDQDHTLRKRVSFDQTAEEPTAAPSAANSLVVREDEETTPAGTPEAARVNGNNLDSVPEETTTPKAPAASPRSKTSLEPGEYFTSPSLKQLQGMSRQQLQNVGRFTVGRHNVGRVEFGRNGEVDLSTVPLDQICGDIVLLDPRNATVYEDDNNKPPMGEGLNVPSTIYLEQSWPRSSRASGGTPQGKVLSAKELQTHKRRLAKVHGTTFKDYDPQTGVWSFTVEHFTTYGLDDSDDDEELEDGTDMLDLQPKIPSNMRTSGLPQSHTKSQSSEGSDDSDMESPDLGEPEDTFEFKLSRRSQQGDLTIPGGFEDAKRDAKASSQYSDDSVQNMQQDEQVMSGGLGDSYMEDPFIEAGGAVQVPSPGAVDRYHSSIIESDEDVDDSGIPGSYHAEALPPRSILKPTANFQTFASPEKVAELPWEEQLQRTMSPKKRDRQALRDMQGSLAYAQPNEESTESPFKKSLFSRSQLGQSHLATKSAKKNVANFGASTMGADTNLGKSQAFTTGMDLINSLWGQPPKETKAKDASAEMPHQSKRRRVSASDINENDAAFYNSFKPSFDGQNALVYSANGSAPQLSGDMKQVIKPLVGGGRDIRFAKFAGLADVDSQTLELQKNHTELLQSETESDQAEVPRAVAPTELNFATLAQVDFELTQEKAIWELSSILFDSLDVCAADLLDGMSQEQIEEYEPRLRLDRFQSFWTAKIAPAVDDLIKKVKSAEEKALLLVVKGDVTTACQMLMDAGDIKLSTLVSQLPGSETSREVMKQQIQMWQERKDWSEFSDAHKALYSILAGETCIVAGLTGAAEDRTQQFCLSERFGLDWQQSLALCLQYGGHESIIHAVSAYIANLKNGKEVVKPLPENSASDGEDTLLGLLRLYALREAQVERLFDSATVSGSALNTRLAWQLATALEAKDLCDLSDEKMDALTLDFASQLESLGAWTKAAWTLLHLSEADSRTIAIQGLLGRSAAQLPSPNLDQDNTLMEDETSWSLSSIQIPNSLIWEAKAVYAHAVLREPALQAQWLLYTGTDAAFTEAHNVLCTTVGPRAVIEKDYTDLRDLLDCFDKHDAKEFAGWKHGGKVYADFLRLLDLPDAKRNGRDGRNACWVLRKDLEGVDEAASGKKGLEVRVALGEVWKVLGEVERETGMGNKWEFEDGEADVPMKEGVVGLLEGYRAALGVVV